MFDHEMWMQTHVYTDLNKYINRCIVRIHKNMLMMVTGGSQQSLFCIVLLVLAPSLMIDADYTGLIIDNHRITMILADT